MIRPIRLSDYWSARASIACAFAAIACADAQRAAPDSVSSVPSAAGDAALEVASSPDSTLWLLPESGKTAAINGATTRADLVKRYGESRLRDEKVGLGDGIIATATVLFPDDSLRKAEIIWVDTTKQDRVARVQINDRRTLWTVGPGITIGTTLKDLERLNGRAFSINGFGWDFGGTVTSWRGGKLTHLGGEPPRAFLQLSPSATSAETESRDLLGDQEFTSDNPAMQRLNPAVRQIVVVFSNSFQQETN